MIVRGYLRLSAEIPARSRLVGGCVDPRTRRRVVLGALLLFAVVILVSAIV
jgi:hypothetical protein